MKLRVVALVVAAGFLVAADTPKREELAKLKGTWKLNSLVNSGLPTRARLSRGAFLIIDGLTYQLQVGKEDLHGTFKLDPAAKPKQIDLIVLETKGKEKGKVKARLHGIYKMESDRLTLCWTAASKPRPRKFVSKVGSEVRLLTAERARP